MEPLTIELKDKNALSILKSLEKAQMIKLIPKEYKTQESPAWLHGANLQKPPLEVVQPFEILNRDQLRMYGFAKDAITFQPDFDDPIHDFKY